MKYFILFKLCIALSLTCFAQASKVTVSGIVHNKQSKNKLSYVTVVVKAAADSAFVAGTVTNEEGLFSVPGISPGNYVIELSYIGYQNKQVPILVGHLSAYLDLGIIDLDEAVTTLSEVVVEGKQDVVSETMEKKVIKVDDNITQTGGSLLQVMQNLPGVTGDGFRYLSNDYLETQVFRIGYNYKF
jgi:hypothetical protein